jgi:hypothetical protein
LPVSGLHGEAWATISGVLFDLLSSLPARFSALTFRGKIFVFACVVMSLELLLRRYARKSRFYAAWTHAFEAVGAVWTGVLLAIVYFASVSLVGLALRVLAKDPLDRSLASEPSFWRAHEPNPLGAQASVRHQF